MSHQDGLGDNGPETTGLSKPDDGDDRMEKKSENVAHSRDGIKLKKLKNSGHLRNSPTTASAIAARSASSIFRYSRTLHLKAASTPIQISGFTGLLSWSTR